MGRRPSPAVKVVDRPGDDAFITDRRVACRGEDPDLFFVDGVGRAAKDICGRCPLVVDCREYAIARPWLFGIWGGTSGNERDRIRRDRQATP